MSEDKGEQVPSFEMQNELKVAINSFIWSNASPDTTLKEAEELAIGFFDKLMATWGKPRAINVRVLGSAKQVAK